MQIFQVSQTIVKIDYELLLTYCIIPASFIFLHSASDITWRP